MFSTSLLIFKQRTRWILTTLAATLAACSSGDNPPSPLPGPSSKPNILFIIMDDVGIDQMAVFGYGGATPPPMPNIDAVARAGVRFRNTWSMPECSPGRAAFFVGRYPTRTHIRQAIGPNDLAVSQLTPYDMTAPKMLKQAGYQSGMFGKFHLAGPEHNEAGHATPSLLGWDHFYGWVGGLPGSIDTTAGGIAPEKTYACGFVPGRQHAGGATTGACYQPDNQCSVIEQTAPHQDAAGLQCLNAGGIFVPNALCGTPPAALAFNRENGYYVSPLVIINDGQVEEVALTDSRARGYRTQIETDAAIAWINSRPGSQPWMATVSYSAAHTPWQQPPASLLATIDPAKDDLVCTETVSGRILQNHMTEAMDAEFGRLLVETGLATRGPGGHLRYDPQASNTVIIIVGDNGSLGTAVKQPFQASQAKGTAYQTGVWDPLIIAGPQVAQADREVDHMVNTVDLFQFFGELAGLDAHQVVPRTIDSTPLLPYLTDPAQPSLRTINFTLGGVNQQANGQRNGPCVVNSSCTQIPTSKSVCEDNQGIWWGANYTDPSVIDNGGTGYTLCADVNQALHHASRPLFTVLPETSMAVRNEHYKLVRNIWTDFNPATQQFETEQTEELYEINQQAPLPLLDTPDRNLWPSSNPEILKQYQDLQAKLEQVLAAEPSCPGDGNQDGVVDAEDLSQWQRIAQQWGLSSVYDFVVNGVRDGLTNGQDESVILSTLNTRCNPSYGVY